MGNRERIFFKYLEFAGRLERRSVSEVRDRTPPIISSPSRTSCWSRRSDRTARSSPMRSRSAPFARRVRSQCRGVLPRRARRGSPPRRSRVFNPWVYNKVVAGHIAMVLAFGATMLLLAELSKERPSTFNAGLYLLLTMPQLQYFLPLLGAFAIWTFVRRRRAGALGVVLLASMPIWIGLLFDRTYSVVDSLHAVVAGRCVARSGSRPRTERLLRKIQPTRCRRWPVRRAGRSSLWRRPEQSSSVSGARCAPRGSSRLRSHCGCSSPGRKGAFGAAYLIDRRARSPKADSIANCTISWAFSLSAISPRRRPRYGASRCCSGYGFRAASRWQRRGSSHRRAASGYRRATCRRSRSMRRRTRDTR